MARRRTIEIDSSEPCPCESGMTYGRCCKKRNFRWERGARERLVRSVPIVPELAQTLKELEAEFIETFGRKPRATDPVFFQQYYISDADLERETLRVMRAAKSPPSLVYAYRKTGRILTQDNKDKLTAAEMEEWNSAIDEYYDGIDSGIEVDVFDDKGGLLGFLLNALRQNQVVGGSFIRQHFNRYRPRKGASRRVETVAAFATTNFVRLLRSVHILVEQGVSFDAYNLLRALYENYLVLKYTYYRPEHSETLFAQLGLLAGTHELVKSKGGTPLQSEIVEIRTGRRIKAPSRWAMASALGGVDLILYGDLYRTLSAYCHSEITTMTHFLSDDGFDYLSHDFTFDVLASSHLLCMMFFSCLKVNSPCAAYLKGDLSIVIERALFALLLIEEELAAAGEAPPQTHKAAIAAVVAHDVDIATFAETAKLPKDDEGRDRQRRGALFTRSAKTAAGGSAGRS